MRIFMILAALAFSASSWALSGRETFKAASLRWKVFLVEEYKAVLEQNPEALAEFSQSTTTSFRLISEAFASEGLDCIYAGWPSQRVGGSCSSPARMNPSYEKGSCASDELHCQPALFGPGLCAPVRTQSQRSRAFSECDKQFKTSNRSVEDVLRSLITSGKEEELLRLLDFADRICQNSKQSGTGMCRRLEAAVLRVRNGLPEVKASIIARGTEVRDAKARNDIITAVTETTTVEAVTRTAGTAPADCDPSEKARPVADANQPPLTVIPFDRAEPRPLDFDFTTSRESSEGPWRNTFVKDKNEAALRPNGFEFRMTGPNAMAGAPIDPEQKVERQWNFVSEDSSRRETYLWVTDDAGSGYLSQLMESIILIVPRVTKPSVQAVGDELHVTLTTGEKVVYDKATRLVKSGVLAEGPVDRKPDRFTRKFAPIKYSGTGISIRVDKRGGDPRLIPGNAVVTQNGKTCNVPAKELWNQEDFRYADDASLVAFLNKKCGNKFSL